MQQFILQILSTGTNLHRSFKLFWKSRPGWDTMAEEGEPTVELYCPVRGLMSMLQVN